MLLSWLVTVVEDDDDDTALTASCVDAVLLLVVLGVISKEVTDDEEVLLSESAAEVVLSCAVMLLFIVLGATETVEVAFTDVLLFIWLVAIVVGAMDAELMLISTSADVVFSDAGVILATVDKELPAGVVCGVVDKAVVKKKDVHMHKSSTTIHVSVLCVLPYVVSRLTHSQNSSL